MGLAALCVAGAAHAQPAPSRACAGPSHRGFDFWVGTWDVYLPDGSKAGENVIEAIAGGCALLENWTGAKGFDGKSLNVFDAKDERWHQFWVDASGTRLELVGSAGPGTMALASTTQRITWTANADGSVRQYWESWDDKTKAWVAMFDGVRATPVTRISPPAPARPPPRPPSCSRSA